jgi:hypothetical protein
MTSQRIWEKCKFRLLSKIAIVRDAWKRIVDQAKTHRVVVPREADNL